MLIEVRLGLYSWFLGFAVKEMLRQPIGFLALPGLVLCTCFFELIVFGRSWILPAKHHSKLLFVAALTLCACRDQAKPRYAVLKLSTQDVVRVCIQNGLVWSAEGEGKCGKPDSLPLLVDLRRPCNGIPSGKCEPGKRSDDSCLVEPDVYHCTANFTGGFSWAKSENVFAKAGAQ